MCAYGIGLDTASADQGGEITGKAADHYKRGRELYAAGRYTDAAVELRRALEYSEHPVLLYNVALAEWRAGRYDEALAMARRAERKTLPTPVEAKTRALASGLGVRARSRAVSERITRMRAASNDTNGGGARLGGRGWIGIGVSSAGLLSLGGALLVDRLMAAKADEYRRAARQNDYARYNRLNTELKRQQRLGIGLLAGGAVATGVGTYLLASDLFASRPSSSIDGRDSDRRVRLRWLPRWRPGFWGVHLQIHVAGH